MELTSDKIKEYSQRLMLVRMRMLSKHGFFGLLLMHMQFSLDESVVTAATDGKRIIFAPEFMDSLTDDELMFIMMHEVLHVVLRHNDRTEDRDDFLFNIACDIVVNSNILKMSGMNKDAITIGEYGESMHKAPNNHEGYEYSAEEVYEMITQLKNVPDDANSFDNHSLWKGFDYEEYAMWKQRIKDAYEASMGRGNLPAGLVREIEKLLEPKVDWRTILHDFIQEEIVDYSLVPPDKRFQDSPFLLPDFNDTEITVKNILFMIDTSASMSDEDVAQAYSEIKGAIDQHNGKLEGWLGFFDAEVIPPVPFTDEEEFKVIKPEGGGGTDFGVIFDYISEEMNPDEISSIIIMTDGYAPYPDESAAGGVPVLWLVNNEDIDPPWGKVARM